MNESNINRVLLWMISGLSDADLERACVERLEVDPARVKQVIAQARRRLTLAAEYNRDELIGTALTRLNDLYSRCLRGGTDGSSPNLAKALDVQREINRLADLYGRPAAADSGDARQSEALEAIAEHLLPLGLTSEKYPLHEHARLAAQRITELEATLKAMQSLK